LFFPCQALTMGQPELTPLRPVYRAQPDLAPLRPVAEPAPLTASERARIVEARYYWYSTWFLVFLSSLLVSPKPDLGQMLAALIVLQGMAFGMQVCRFDSLISLSLSIANL
jgi:hypothetical protein